jgi:hypothetical protein
MRLYDRNVLRISSTGQGRSPTSGKRGEVLHQPPDRRDGLEVLVVICAGGISSSNSTSTASVRVHAMHRQYMLRGL